MRIARSLAGLALALLAALIGGCNKKIQLPVVVDQRPEVRLTQAPTGTKTPYFYSYELRWSGFDPDGRVDHFAYAVDPPEAVASETSWVATTENRKTFTFSSSDPDSFGTVANPGGHHTFVIKAVDDQGLASPVVSRTFFSYTVAPEVVITQPTPTFLLHPVLPPTITFLWSGRDPDGVTTQKPVKYKYRLFKNGVDGFDANNTTAFFYALRHTYAPNFAGWDSTVTDTMHQYIGLTPGSIYVFAVVAFDEAGAYSASWSFEANLLYFYCDYPISYGPVITMYSDFFHYTYITPGYVNDPQHYVFLEVPVNAPVTLRWYATPPKYANMKGYRWAMDIARLDDDTPRSGPNDYRHWSYLGLSNTSATIGPFTGADSSHVFFIEAEDNNGLKSLGIISMTVIHPDFQRDLLFVDDTGLPLDGLVYPTDSIAPPYGLWPTRAELDTFFFARGGMPWKGYPWEDLSPPGIFNGYRFDTLTTFYLYDPTVPLSTLARYRHVVWYSDQGAAYGRWPPVLRTMSTPGRQNTLAVYARLGGQVWLMGGGGGYSTTIPFNTRANDIGSAVVFSSTTDELTPGRFMYDLPHWQSEFWSLLAQGASRSPAAVGGWPGAPDYSSLPSVLQARSVATDPIWPFRLTNEFYRAQCEAEVVSKPNLLAEDFDPSADGVLLRPPLDTLYTATGGAGAGMPIMTLYHGLENPPFLFSGFPLWHFRREQAIRLADWVLQDLWHLPREPLSRGPAAAPARREPAAPASAAARRPAVPSRR